MGDCNSTPVEGSIRVTVIFKEFSNYVEFGGQATVFDLKIEVTNEFDIPGENLQVVYNGQTLSDDGVIEQIVTDLAIPITIIDTRTPEQIAAQPGKTPQLVSTDVPKIAPKPTETAPPPPPPPPPPPEVKSEPIAVVAPLPPRPVASPLQSSQGPRPPSSGSPPLAPRPIMVQAAPRQLSPQLRPIPTPRAIAPINAPRPGVASTKVKSAPPPPSGNAPQGARPTATKTVAKKGPQASGDNKAGAGPKAGNKPVDANQAQKVTTLQEVANKIMDKKPAGQNAGGNAPVKKTVKNAANPGAGAKGKPAGNEAGIEPAKGKGKKVVKKTTVTTTTTTKATAN